MSKLESRLYDAFLKKLKDELPLHQNSQKESFHAVNDNFEEVAGFKPYANYDSFKNAKSRRKKRGW